MVKEIYSMAQAIPYRQIMGFEKSLPLHKQHLEVDFCERKR